MALTLQRPKRRMLPGSDCLLTLRPVRVLNRELYDSILELLGGQGDVVASCRGPAGPCTPRAGWVESVGPVLPEDYLGVEAVAVAKVEGCGDTDLLIDRDGRLAWRHGSLATGLLGIHVAVPKGGFRGAVARLYEEHGEDLFYGLEEGIEALLGSD